MSRVAESTYKSVLASMREAFPHMLVFVYGSDSMIIASMEPIATDWDEWQRRVNVPAVQEDLAFYGLGDPLDVLGLLMADTALVDAYIRTSDRVNTDDNAWLEHQMPIDRYSPETNDPIPNRMARSTASGRLRAIENAVPGIPLEALVEHVLRHPPTKSARVHEFLLRFVSQYVREVGEAALLPSLADWHETRNRPLKARREFVLLEREYDRALDSADTTAVETSLRKMAGFPQLTIFHEWMMIRVEFLIGQRRLDEALDLLGQLRRRSPSRSAVYRLGAEVAEELGNFAEAQRYRAQLALIPPDDSADSADFDPWAVRDQITWADELSEVSLFEDAAVHARRALELDGENATAHVSLGQALYYLDRREEALAQFRLALELEPGSSNLHARMGVILAEDGRFDEAEEHIRAALDLNPKSATVEFLWGSVLWRQGKFAEAARRFEAALEIDPSNERIRKRLNEARVRVGREAS
jgi:tetratricopeptide (TPR) repeat protein